MSLDGSNAQKFTTVKGSFDLALTKGALFVANNNTLLKVKRDGSGTEQFTTTLSRIYGAISADDAFVYVSDYQGDGACSLGFTSSIVAIDQKSGSETLVADKICGPRDFVSDGKYVYFRETPYDDTPDYKKGVTYIRRVLRTGGAPETIATVTQLSRFALSNGWIYMLVGTDPSDDFSPDQLARVSVNGGTVESGLNNCSGFYWDMLPTSDGVVIVDNARGGFTTVRASDNAHEFIAMPSSISMSTNATTASGNTFFYSEPNGAVWRIERE
jgi:hypothetical protein